MKRRGYVIEEICEMDNLRLAYWKAKRGKSAKQEVVRYTQDLQAHLLELRDLLLQGKIPPIDYHYFTVFDPKERQICATVFHQRVLQHALMNVCHADFERYQTNDSYASRLGRGTYAALDKAIANQKRFRYCLKLDVRKYFDSIRHNVLKLQVRRLYKDARLINIFEQIIDSYSVYEHRGLPIGNLTSQYFANHYLAVADHYVREQLRVKAYVRYMDDMLLWGNDKNTLKQVGKAMQQFIEVELGLQLKVFSLTSTEQMCTFLGYRMSRTRQCLSPRSIARYEQKVRDLYWQYNQNMLTQEDMNNHLLPLVGFTMHVASGFQRANVMARL